MLVTTANGSHKKNYVHGVLCVECGIDARYARATKLASRELTTEDAYAYILKLYYGGTCSRAPEQDLVPSIPSVVNRNNIELIVVIVLKVPGNVVDKESQSRIMLA